MNSAIVTLVTDENGSHCVVTQADDVIWLADELIREAQDPNRKHISGDLEIAGDILSFGTPGEGLGRLTYRVIERCRYVSAVHVAQRVQP